MSPGYSRSELIEMSIRVELAGERFYQGAAGEVAEHGARELLRALASDEKRHAEVFQSIVDKRFKEETKGMTPEEARPYIESLLASSVLKVLVEDRQKPRLGSTAAILDFALGFEKETLLFYYSIRDYVSSAAVPVIDRVISEEKKHVEKISALRRLA